MSLLILSQMSLLLLSTVQMIGLPLSTDGPTSLL
jgi:hypothetical protein